MESVSVRKIVKLESLRLLTDVPIDNIPEVPGEFLTDDPAHLPWNEVGHHPDFFSGQIAEAVIFTLVNLNRIDDELGVGDFRCFRIPIEQSPHILWMSAQLG